MNESPRSPRWSGLNALLALVVLFALLAYGVTEEQPVGSFRGTLLSPINRAPLKNVAVVLRPSVIDDQYESLVRTVRTNEKGEFAFPAIPAGNYVMSAFGRAMSIERVPVEIVEGQTQVQDHVLECWVPQLDLDMAQHVFTPQEEPVVQIRGSSSAAEVKLVVIQVPAEVLSEQGGIEGVARSIRQGSTNDPRIKTIRDQNRPIRERDGEGIILERVGLGVLPEGAYLILASLEDKTEMTYALVSRIALVSKVANQQALAYVTDIVTGKPVAGAQVSLVYGFQRRELGKTSDQGVVEKRVESPISAMQMVARIGNSIALARAPVMEPETGEDLALFIHTDRPIYRPGDTVQFRGILRRRIQSGLEMSSLSRAQVVIRDSDDNILRQETVTLDRHGIFIGEFDTLADVTGTYRIEVQLGGVKRSKYVEIASYRKPEFIMKVTPVKPIYSPDEPIQMKVQLTYYFGGPVVGARLDGWAETSNLYTWQNEDEEEEEYEGYGGSFLGEIESSVTNERGEAIVTYRPEPADEKAKNRNRYTTPDQRVTFNLTATEQGDKYIEAKGTTKLVQGDYALRIADPVTYVQPDQDQTVRAQVTTHDGKPVSGVSVRWEVSYEEYDPAQRRSYRVRLAQSTSSTDPEGTSTFQFRPDRSGLVIVRAQLLDSQRRRIESELYLWCWDGWSDVSLGPATDLELKLDQKRYQPGQNAELLIRSQIRGAVALVTLEGDQIYRSYRVPLQQELNRISIPVDRNLAPNVYVVATVVSEKQFFTQSRRLVVEDQSQRLQVQVQPDRPQAQPGETVRWNITTRDASGRGVPAQVALGVVDEAIYAIREDSDDIVRSFYQRRYNNVLTSYSFEEIYLDGGEKGPAQIEMRRDFKDTAQWTPRISTGPNGTASVEVKLPDNLTTWRATATAASDQHAFGQGVGKVLVRKPLMVRLSAPTYLVQEDEVRVTATVTNGTDAVAPVTIRFNASGAKLSQGSAESQIDVAAESSRTLEWRLQADTLGNAVLQVTAQSPKHQDGMELTVPVRALGRPVMSFNAGALTTSETTLRFNRLPTAEEGQVELKVSPSLAATMMESLDDLVDFPYGCVEQTMNRFMPAVVAGRAIQSLGLNQPAILARVPEVAQRSIRRLRTLQHQDGGFGWWENDSSDPEMSALVLEGLWRSRTAGFATDATMEERLVKYCRAWLTTQETLPSWADETENRDFWLDWRLDRRAAVIHALARIESRSVVRDEVLSTRLRTDAPLDHVALFALAAQAMSERNPNDSAMRRRKEELLQRLRASATETGEVALYTGRRNTETSARALEAFVREDSTDPLVRKIIRGLLDMRRGDSWRSTRDTGLIVLALSDYLLAQPQQMQPASVEILVNGELFDAATIGAVGESSPNRIWSWPVSRFKSGENILTLKVTGSGQPWYTFKSEQVPYQKEIGVLKNSSGLTIEREYYPLIVRRLEDGSRQLSPGDDPVSTFTSGQNLRVVVKIEALTAAEFVMIEVPTPSNFRVTENGQPETWSWWWSKTDILDQKVVFFARSMSPGTHVVEYNIRAEAPGIATALPSRVYEMYNPDREGASNSLRFEVKP